MGCTGKEDHACPDINGMVIYDYGKEWSKRRFCAFCQMDVPSIDRLAKTGTCTNVQAIAKMFTKLNQWQFANFVTGDEIWVHFFGPVRKIGNQDMANQTW